ncbi:MAG: nucleotidyltransferase domain-containing protein [Defluviitaleaceae bacterium]|nr:nucleotidyltransferase domain-containing protein [Defluviitaleaceae bacterium]
MLNHHKDSIQNMIAHFRQCPETLALFLVGSVATGTARPDSDIDGVAIVTSEAHKRRKAEGTTLEVVHGKCTYEGGYFDIHYHTREDLINLAQNGSEPMRNLFTAAKPLFCDEPDLPELAAKVSAFPKADKPAKQLRFYCTFKQYHRYFWVACKPKGFSRFHVADGMIFTLYRLILLENEILFPSMRGLENAVISAPNKPKGIIELCHRFMQTLSDEDAKMLLESYETWTSYDFPKDSNIIMNNFANQWEWY